MFGDQIKVTTVLRRRHQRCSADSQLQLLLTQRIPLHALELDGLHPALGEESPVGITIEFAVLLKFRRVLYKLDDLLIADAITIVVEEIVDQLA